jgi:hypothetical protein
MAALAIGASALVLLPALWILRDGRAPRAQRSAIDRRR